MRTPRLSAILLLAQAVGRILTVLVILGTVPLSGRFALELLLVTLVQTLALAGVQNLARLSSRQPKPEHRLPLIVSWPILTLTFSGSMVAYDLLWYDHLDLTFPSYVQAILVPAFQALCLAAASIKSWSSLPRDLVGVFNRERFLIVVTAADIGVLWLALGRVGSSESSFLPAGVLPVYYLGLKGLSAGILTLLCARRHGGTRAERIWIGLLGLGLAGYGWDQVFGWIAPLPGLLFPHWPLLFQWIFVYGPLILVVLLLVGRVSEIWRKGHPGAALWLRVALAFLLFGTLIVAIDVYNRPVLPLFWAKLVWLTRFLCISGMWIAVWDFSGAHRLRNSDSSTRSSG